MKNIVKLAVIGTLVSAGAIQANAQSSVAQNITISISGFSDSGPVRIGTKDVISELGGAKGDKLIRLASIPTDDTSVVSYVLRPKGTKGSEDVDVTDLISRTEASDTVIPGGKKIDYEINHFQIFHSSDTNDVAFIDVQGYTVFHSKTVKKKSVSADTFSADATVSGTATISDYSVVKGKIKISPGRIE